MLYNILNIVKPAGTVFVT